MRLGKGTGGRTEGAALTLQEACWAGVWSGLTQKQLVTGPRHRVARTSLLLLPVPSKSPDSILLWAPAARCSAFCVRWGLPDSRSLSFLWPPGESCAFPWVLLQQPLRYPWAGPAVRAAGPCNLGGERSHGRPFAVLASWSPAADVHVRTSPHLSFPARPVSWMAKLQAKLAGELFSLSVLHVPNTFYPEESAALFASSAANSHLSSSEGSWLIVGLAIWLAFLLEGSSHSDTFAWGHVSLIPLTVQVLTTQLPRTWDPRARPPEEAASPQGCSDFPGACVGGLASVGTRPDISVTSEC